MVEPGACVAEAVLCDVEDHCAEGDDAAGNEEGFGGMDQGGLQGLRVFDEADGDHDAVEDEEEEVKDEEYGADGVEPWEAKGNCVVSASPCPVLAPYAQALTGMQ